MVNQLWHNLDRPSLSHAFLSGNIAKGGPGIRRALMGLFEQWATAQSCELIALATPAA
jgi:hypothetical protein